MSGFDGRHPGVTHFDDLFTTDHLPERLAPVSAACRDLAETVLAYLPDDGPELTAGLRKLLEAKDCFVRHAVLTGTAGDQDREEV
jgi:hypothetical protein